MLTLIVIMIEVFQTAQNLNTTIIKNIFKNERKCRDIKTEKAHKQDWDGTLAKQYTNHFHIHKSKSRSKCTYVGMMKL